MPRRPSLLTVLGVALLIVAVAIAVAALQSRSARQAPPDWAALCSPDPAAADRGTTRIVLDAERRDVASDDRYSVPVRVPTTFVNTTPTSGIAALSAIYPEFLTLAFTLPETRIMSIATVDADALLRALGPGLKADAPWMGDQALMTITARPHGPTPNFYLKNRTVIGSDEKSGLAKLSYDRSPYEGNESYEVLVDPNPTARRAIFWCYKGSGARCRLYLDAVDGIHASLLFDRFRLVEAPALEATTRALLRCFLIGGQRP